MKFKKEAVMILFLLAILIIPLASTEKVLISINNSLTKETIQFLGDSNITRYISIPKDTTVSSATINLSGDIFDKNDESEDSYYYSYTGGFVGGTNGINFVDEDWNSLTSCENCTYYINYSVPDDLIYANATIKYNIQSNGNFINYSCWNGNDWIRVIFINMSSSNLNTTSRLNESCLNNSDKTLQLKISAFESDGKLTGLVEEKVVWNLTFDYPYNPFLDVGNDSIHEWNYTGKFDHSSNKTSDLSSAINTALNGGSCDCDGCIIESGNCTIPIILNSNTSGKINWSALDIKRTNVAPNISIVLNSTFGSNLSKENLTAYVDYTDYDGDSVYLIYDWRKDSVSDLVVNLPFDVNYSEHNFTSRIRDYSTNSFNGTGGSGNKSKTPYWLDGCFNGGCYNFSRSDNEYINLSNINPFSNKINTTISLWIKMNSSWYPSVKGDSNYFYIISKEQDSGHPLLSIYIEFANSGLADENFTRIMAVSDSPSDSGVLCTDTNCLSDNEWHNIVVIQNGINIEFYYDGNTYVGTNNGVTNINQGYSSYSFLIGRSQEDGFSFDGYMDEFKIFNRSLTPDEIRMYYNDGIGMFNRIHSNATSRGDKWTACVYPNDLDRDENVVCLNISIISTNIENSSCENCTLDGSSYIELNISDAKNSIIDYVNFSIYLGNGTIMLNNGNGTKISGNLPSGTNEIWWSNLTSISFYVDFYKDWYWNVTIKNNRSEFIRDSGSFEVTIDPTITINSPTADQTFTSTNISLNISTTAYTESSNCFYSLQYQTTGAYENTNTSIICNSTSILATLTTDYTLWFWINNSHNNQAVDRINFSISSANPPAGGGGGGGIPEETICPKPPNWFLDGNRRIIDNRIPLNTFRKRSICLLNNGTEKYDIDILCDDTSVNATRFICEYVNVSRYEIELQPNLQQQECLFITTNYPEGAEFGDAFFYGLVLKDEDGCEKTVSVSNVVSRVQSVSKLGQSTSINEMFGGAFKSENGGIRDARIPIILIYGVLLGLIFGIGLLIYFSSNSGSYADNSKEKKGTWALYVFTILGFVLPFFVIAYI